MKRNRGRSSMAARWMAIAACVAASLLVGTGASALPRDAQVAADASDNVELIRSFPYTGDDEPFYIGGTDLAFSGRFVYAAEQGWEGATGGVHIYDTAGPKPKKVGFVACGGWQNDVAVVKPGLIAVGYHQGVYNCGNKDGGVTLFDVSDPRHPRRLGTTKEELPPGDDPLSGFYIGIHSITHYPGTDLIYASPGGRQMESEPQEAIIDVSNPKKPRVAAAYDSGIGCHDVTFDIRKDRKLAFCAGPGETQIWDVSDPLRPQVIGHMVNPFQSFHHSVAISSDGMHAVVGTETTGNDCVGGPTAPLVLYDISDPTTPLMKGHFGAPRGPHPVFLPRQEPEGDCAAHLFNIIPGTLTVVGGNYWGGLSVVDFSDATAPREVAHYRTDSTKYWAATGIADASMRTVTRVSTSSRSRASEPDRS